jgi:5-amino-6-(5-phospho-D-ribitylamino)uracil phosphatase
MEPKIVKILYVSDLDGTLLKSNDKMSEYTTKTINNLIDNGMCFSYATARSLSSASIVTNGLTTNIPVIIHNGTFIINAYTKERLFSLYFTEEEKTNIIDILNKYPVYPLVYGFINNKEKVSWITNKENDGIKRYLNLRKGDRIITFGDSVNDIPMFKISDESYAVENAVDELKKYATGIIMSNEKDGVAHWLEENYIGLK